MQRELFSNQVKKKKTVEELLLLKYDKKSLPDRIERLKFLNQIFPDGYILASDMETSFIFDETKMAFINGELISTILLSQAFIERRLQVHYQSLGLDSISRRGIKAIIDHAKKYKTIHSFLLPKIDELRQKRNPFVHLKDFEHKYTIIQRVLQNGVKALKLPHEIIYEDAKEAIKLMYAIFVTPLA